MSGESRFLVTGALGCVGAWTVRAIVREGAPVVAFDPSPNRRRLAQIMTADELGAVRFVAGDITDLDALTRVLDEERISNVIHLAALQVPFCRADPPLGALVNVVGTVNVFEAVKRRGGTPAPVVYTSSIGMFGTADADPSTQRLVESAEAHPVTHYGVYKRANEGTARVYALEDGVRSIGLRPMTIYGLGRDQGMTSGPTAAIAAAVLGRPFQIGFAGPTLFQYAEDVAATLLAASRSTLDGASVFNLGGTIVDIADWIAAIEELVPGSAGSLSARPTPLPFPSDIEHDALAALGPLPVTPYRDGIAATIEGLHRLQAEGQLVASEQGLPA
jgi:nucleoside-diphosphate-sugar epimerase